MKSSIVFSLILVFCFFSIVTNLAFAELIEFRPRNKKVERLKRELELNDDQARQIEDILVSQKRSCEEITEPSQRWRCMRNSRNKTNREIGSLLSEDQRDQFDEITNQLKQKRSPRQRGRKQSGRGYMERGETRTDSESEE